MRTAAAFWVLGVLNNSLFVLLNAGATFIVAGGVGLVYLANTLPCFAVQLLGPYYFDSISARARVTTCAACFCLSVSVVASSSSTTVQLLAVGLGSFAQGLGEASFLGITSQFGANTRSCVTAWSSGTGFAGIFGFAWKACFVDLFGFSFSTTLLLSNLLPVLYLLTYVAAFRPGDVVLEGEEGDEDGGEEGSSEDEDASLLDTDSGSALSLRQKVDIFRSQQAFLIPLFVVYVAEYSMQSGTWAAIGFPVESAAARDQFYTASNWLYQCGVFVSRSSGNAVRVTLPLLWAMPALQVVLLFFFIFDASAHFWYSNGLLTLCFVVGLLGGAVYVHTFVLMSRAIKSEKHREFAMSAAAVAATGGTALSNVLGVIIQGCLFKDNGIPGAAFSC